jgi:KaiC/GvpD/RAD55 family RecA-like ATPase
MDDTFDVVVEVRVLKARVDDWMVTTDDYRKILCNKIDKIVEKLEVLPCRERKTFYDSISTQMRTLWVFVTAIVLLIIAEWFKR